MARVSIDGFMGGAYRSRSWKASSQRCLNLFPESDPEKGKVLYGTPGINIVAGDFPSAVSSDKRVLGMLATPKGLIVATDRAVYRVLDVVKAGSSFGSTGTTLLGAYGPSAYVSMAQAGDRVMIVNGLEGVWIDLNTPSMATIADADFPSLPKACAAVDGYFLVSSEDSDIIQWSAPFDPSSWDALDFVSAENVNDSIQTLMTVERDVYVVGEQSTEIYTNVGGDEVFAKISGTFVPFGTPAKESVASIGQSLLWLAQDQYGGYFVVQAMGLQSQRISNYAIENELSSYSILSDAYAFTYQQHGHAFYCLTFPSVKKTWVYDLSEKEWHERSSPEIYQNSRIETYWGARCHAYFNGVNLVGAPYSDSFAARIGALDTSVYVDNGMGILRLRSTPHIFSDHDYVTVSAAEFVMETGMGVETSSLPYQVSPKATLKISKDGGRTYGYSRSTELGKQGNYKTRCRFNRLGRARDFVMELSVSDPVPVAISGAYMDVEQ